MYVLALLRSLLALTYTTCVVYMIGLALSTQKEARPSGSESLYGRARKALGFSSVSPSGSESRGGLTVCMLAALSGYLAYMLLLLQLSNALES
jgi:hypothetical protein